jgi:hypothetical protein
MLQNIFISFLLLFLNSKLNSQTLIIRPSIGSSVFFSNSIRLQQANDNVYVTPRPNIGLSFEFFYKNLGLHTGLILAKGVNVFELPDLLAISKNFSKIYLNYRGWQSPILLTTRINLQNKKITLRPYGGISVGLTGNFNGKSGIQKTTVNGVEVYFEYDIYSYGRFFPTFAGNLGLGIDYKISKKLSLFGTVFSIIGYKPVVSYKASYRISSSSSSGIIGDATLFTKSDQYILQLGLAYKIF